MNKMSGWVLSSSVAIIAVCFIVFLTMSPASTKPLSESVIIAIIGALAAGVTILSSIYIAKSTNNANEKQQQDMDARRIKQEKYNAFLDIFSKVIFYKEKHSEELNKNDYKLTLEYAVEYARLPLYASEDVVELLQKNPGTELAVITELFRLIRKDLCDNTFTEFKKISNIQIHYLL